MRCGWWNRWWHRRKRYIDTLALLPALKLRAEQDVTVYTAYEPLSELASRWVEQRVDAAFALHRALPGNDHWQCACAREDGYYTP